MNSKTMAVEMKEKSRLLANVLLQLHRLHVLLLPRVPAAAIVVTLTGTSSSNLKSKLGEIYFDVPKIRLIIAKHKSHPDNTHGSGRRGRTAQLVFCLPHSNPHGKWISNDSVTSVCC